jgi:hypothetical protein
MNIRNLVAKNAHKYNRSKVVPDKKKQLKRNPTWSKHDE